MAGGGRQCPRGSAVRTQRSGDSVIVRVLRVRVRAGRVGAFNALFRGQVALLREQDGLLYAKLARRLQPDGGEEAVLFEEWQDAASLYAWVGPNLTEPRLVPGVRELIDEVHVAHYEALADDAEPISVDATRGEVPRTDPPNAGPSTGDGRAREARHGEEAS
jgi:quinol monooxygenase YgiN